MRLDIFLVENGFFDSRNKASEAIKEANIKVDGKIIKKPSFMVEESCDIEVFKKCYYVSRAGYKLKEFLKECEIDIKDKRCLDIGSSTGGFVEVLLEYGAKSVTAVDVGKDQLHKRVKSNSKVISLEGMDIREFEDEDGFDVVTCDVSFVGIEHILPKMKELSNDKIIILFKPQFEVGKDVKRDKKGVVKDKKAIQRAEQKFESLLVYSELKIIKKDESKLKGKEGNVEYFYYIQR